MTTTNASAKNTNEQRWKLIKQLQKEVSVQKGVSGIDVTSLELMEAYSLEAHTDTAVMQELRDFAETLSEREGISESAYNYLTDITQTARERKIDITG